MSKPPTPPQQLRDPLFMPGPAPRVRKPKVKKLPSLFTIDLCIADNPNNRLLMSRMLGDDPKLAAAAEEAVIDFIGQTIVDKWKIKTLAQERLVLEEAARS